MDDNYLYLRDRDRRTSYYWLLAMDANGRPIIMGPYLTEQKAQQVGFEKIKGTFTVEELKTRDPNKATKELKYKVFYDTANIENATRRANHQGNKDNRFNKSEGIEQYE